MGEGDPLPEKKSGRKNKAKRKDLVDLDWSGEQESVGSSSAQHLGSSNRFSPSITGNAAAVTATASKNSTRVQEQVQQVKYGDRTRPGFSGKAEATVPMASNIDPELLKLARIPRTSNIDPELLKLAKIPMASNIDPELLKQAQAAEATLKPAGEAEATLKHAEEAEATPKQAGEAEATIPTESELSLVTSKSTDHPMADTFFDDLATAAEPIPSPDVQENDVLPHDSHSPTASGQTGEHHVFQQDQEEQHADNWSSENMRPNAQNLRYGGYPAQPAPQHRNTPLGSGRLQNTSKLGGLEILHLVSVIQSEG